MGTVADTVGYGLTIDPTPTPRQMSLSRVPPRFARLRPRLGLILVALVVSSGAARAASAQRASTIAGAAGGLIAGGYTMTAVYVAEARFGHFLHSYDEMLAFRPEILPVIAGGVAGGWLGAESGTALARSAGWGGLGLVGGAALGAGLGHLIGRSSEGRWAGGIIGSAVGLVAGAILGAADALDDESDPGALPQTLFSVSLAVGGGG